MKFLIMQFSPTSCRFISLRSEYFPQHPNFGINSKLAQPKGPNMLEEEITESVSGTVVTSTETQAAVPRASLSSV
jgi:hypothetical protein